MIIGTHQLRRVAYACTVVFVALVISAALSVLALTWPRCMHTQITQPRITYDVKTRTYEPLQPAVYIYRPDRCALRAAGLSLHAMGQPGVYR